MTALEMKTLIDNTTEEVGCINLNHTNYMNAKNSEWFSTDNFIYTFCGLAMNQINSLKDDEVYLTMEPMPVV